MLSFSDIIHTRKNSIKPHYPKSEQPVSEARPAPFEMHPRRTRRTEAPSDSSRTTPLLFTGKDPVASVKPHDLSGWVHAQDVMRCVAKVNSQVRQT